MNDLKQWDDLNSAGEIDLTPDVMDMARKSGMEIDVEGFVYTNKRELTALISEAMRSAAEAERECCAAFLTKHRQFGYAKAIRQLPSDTEKGA